MYGEKLCTVDGCERPLRARGCCDHHYHRLTVYGSVYAETARELSSPWRPDDGIIDEVAVSRVLSGWGQGIVLTSRECDEVIRRMLDRFGDGENGVGLAIRSLALSLDVTESRINERVFKIRRAESTADAVHCACALGRGGAGCCLARDIATRPAAACRDCFFNYQQGHDVAHGLCSDALPGADRELERSA